MSADVQQRLKLLPEGYSECQYKSRRYAVTRHSFNQGRSLKVLARELGGRDFISFNLYYTQQTAYLKPCEMPRQKVLDFLHHFRPVH